MNMHTMPSHEDHKARRQRLWVAGNQRKLLVAPVEDKPSVQAVPIQLVIAKPDSKAQRIKVLEAIIRERDLQISDMQASALRMAEMIAGYIAREAVEEEVDAIDAEDREVRPVKRPIRAIVEEVLRDYPGITWEDVKGVHRSRALTTPRHHCMAAVYEQRPDLSFPSIARHFDRDHTTVLHAVKKFSTLRAKP